MISKLNSIAHYLWIDERRKIPYGLTLAVVFYTFYLIPNQFGVYLSPSYLPMFSFEHDIPLIPATQWIYHLEVPYLFIGYLTFNSSLTRTRFAASMIFLIAICSFIFILFPTTYPRHIYETNLVSTDFHSLALKFFWQYVDQATNCLPSLHVATCFMMSFALKDESKLKFLVGFTFSIAVTLSTLTTKQHYIIDCIAGLLLTTIIWYTIGKRIKPPISNV